MNNESSLIVSVRDLVSRLGTQEALAELVGVTQQAVSGWCRKNKLLPHKHVLKVAAATGIAKEDLAPDIYPRDAAPPTASGGGASGGAGGVSTASRADRPTPESLSGISA